MGTTAMTTGKRRIRRATRKNAGTRSRYQELAAAKVIRMPKMTVKNR